MKLFTLFLFSLLVFGCATPQPLSTGNQLYQYLYNAEIQYENEEQAKELLRAFKEVLDRPEKVSTYKYADYGGTANTWTFRQMVHRYIVPDKPMDIPTEEEFKSQVRDPDVRREFRKKILELEN